MSTKETIYSVKVLTGSIKDAGTDAEIYIQLCGEKGTSKDLQLDTKENNFEKGSLDEFSVKTNNVGWLNKIRLSLNDDNGKSGPGWFVSYVEVTDDDHHVVWHIDINQWMGTDDKNTCLEANVPVASAQLEVGSMSNKLLGYIDLSYTNKGFDDTEAVNSFQVTYKRGSSVDLSKSTTADASVKLGYDFFGVNAEFSTSISHTTSTQLHTEEEETYSLNIDFKYPVKAQKSITPVFLFSQYYLSGSGVVNNVKIDCLQKFLITYQTVVFDGLLSPEEIEKNLKDIFSHFVNQHDNIKQYQCW